MKKPKKTDYTYQFKQNAILLVKTTNRSVQAVALELGVPAWKLRGWLKEEQEKIERSSDIDELLQMRHRIKELEEEVDILKKAAVYFAKASQ